MRNQAITVLACLPIFLLGQQLQVQDTILTTLDALQKHRYTIAMEDNEIAFITLNQIGIDVAVTTYDAMGKKIADFDSPNGSFGPEPVRLKSTKKGWYAIEVASIDTRGTKGTYELYIKKKVDQAITSFGRINQVFLPWDDQETPGAAVAIIREGKVVFQNTYGYANLEYGIPITTKTVFRTGSVAKQFTAFSILLLEDQGKLSLEDDVRKYIPEVPDFGHKITLRHLANHTSGLREEAVLAALMGWDEGDIVTKTQVLNVIAQQKELNFKPGEQYLYCNTGYTLLAEVVARVTGKSFSTFTDEAIFAPLGMQNTLFLENPRQVIKNKAYSYYQSGNGYLKAILNDANSGGSGLLTTIEDLVLWVQNFEQLKVGTSAIFKTMQLPGKLNDGMSTSYGMGMEKMIYKGIESIGHGGALGGFRARIARFPSDDLAIVLLANTPGVHPLHVPNEIADIFLDEVLQSKDNRENHENTAISNSDKHGVSFDPKDIETYLGKYYSEELATEYEFTLQNGTPVLKHPRLQIQLNPSAKDEFVVEGWAMAKIKLLRTPNNMVSGFKFSMINTKNIHFTKR